MSRMSRIALLSLAWVLAVSAVIRAAEPIHIVTSTSAVRGAALQMLQETLTKVFEEKGKGQFTFEHYDSGTLYKQDAEVQAVLNNEVDMTFQSASWLGEIGMQWCNMFDMAFIYKNIEHQQALFNPKNELGGKIFNRIEKELNGQAKVLGAQLQGTRYLWLRKASMIVNKPEDMKPIKLRMSNSTHWLLQGRALGANPTPLDLSEVYLALQTGAIDAQDNSVLSAYKAKYGEVCESIARTDHLLACALVFLSGKTWDKMTPDQQTLFSDLVYEAIQITNSKILGLEEEIAKELEANGMKIQHPDVSAFKAYAEKVFREDPYTAQWDWDLLKKINDLAAQY